jgi:hypothetical protein
MKGKKTGGRQLGTPNVITSDLRALLSEMVTTHLSSDLMQLEPLKRAELMIKCLPYLMPQYTESMHNCASHNPIVITLDHGGIDQTTLQKVYTSVV